MSKQNIQSVHKKHAINVSVLYKLDQLYKLRTIIDSHFKDFFFPDSICFLRFYPLGNQAARGRTV